MGKTRHELDGPFAFAAWLGVHAMPMTGVRTRIEAFIDWLWAYFSNTRGPQVLNRSDAARRSTGRRTAPQTPRRPSSAQRRHELEPTAWT